MALLTKMKKAINRWLENIAEENKQIFGEGKLDCCQLNNKKTVEYKKEN